MNAWKKKIRRWHNKHSMLKPMKYGKKILKKHKNSLVSIYGKLHTNIMVPENFSLCENTNGTIDFICDFINKLSNGQHGERFFIDSSKVKNVTVDAIIYLIALMGNNRNNIIKKYTYSGKLPIDEKARKVYQECGFMNYVSSNVKKLPCNTEKMEIREGKTNDPVVVKDFCGFVNRVLKNDRNDTRCVYKILIELLSNVYNHAYDVHGIMANKWYMYAEHVENYVRFVVVDTGKGITNTIRKNHMERLLSYVKIISDGRLLKSVFEGEFRTETNELNRGNGLPGVKDNVIRSGNIKNFKVYSGKCSCYINCDIKGSNIEIQEYKKFIYGTLYSFEIHTVGE